jgi:formylglycine-generating enzyme required for sulfatase activity
MARQARREQLRAPSLFLPISLLLVSSVFFALSPFRAFGQKEAAPQPTTSTPLAALPSLAEVTLDGMAFVKIPAGTFRMGTTNAQREAMKAAREWSRLLEVEQPAHFVTISKPFLLAKCELTQALWTRVMKEKTAPPPGRRAPKVNPSTFLGQDLPVETVSWDDVQSFLKRLNAQTGSKYRLPTEAEWEYACRAGSDEPFGMGADGKPVSVEYLPEYAWYSADSDNKTHPVGSKKPNAWGLNDTMGNVWEWCQDYFAPDFYRLPPQRDPVNATESTERVFRGGCWFLEPPQLRCAARGANLSTFKSPYVGLRLARDL